MWKPDPNAMSWAVSGWLPDEFRPVIFWPRNVPKFDRETRKMVPHMREARTRIEHFEIRYSTSFLSAMANGNLLRKDFQPYENRSWDSFSWTKRPGGSWIDDRYLARHAPDHEYASVPEWLAAIVEANIPEDLKEVWQ